MMEEVPADELNEPMPPKAPPMPMEKETEEQTTDQQLPWRPQVLAAWRDA